MAAEIIDFPPWPSHRVERRRDKPALLLVLPVIRIEREETPAQKLGRFLNRVLDGERPSRQRRRRPEDEPIPPAC